MPTTNTPDTTTTDRPTEALRLRELGYTFDGIARALGLPHRQAARGLVTTALRRRARSSYATTAPVTGLVGLARRFGIEIECEGITADRAARALEDAGIACENRGYTHAVMATWKVVHDGSLRGGCEVVSPPMSGEAGFDEVRRVMAALRGAGAVVSHRCGMHVHVDATDLTGTQIGALINSYTDNQNNVDRLVARSRRNQHSGYCARWQTSAKDAVVAAFARGEGQQVAGQVSRYRTVNVASYARYGTIEFRQHQGSLNGTKAVAWVRFLLSLATLAEAGTPVVAVATTEDLLAAVRPVMGEAAHQYLSHRALAA